MKFSMKSLFHRKFTLPMNFPMNSLKKLIADRPHPCDNFTHKHLGLDKDSSLLFAELSKAEPLISTAMCKKFVLAFDPDLWPWPLTLSLRQCNSDVKTQFLAFDLVVWPTTLTYNLNLAKVKVDPHTKNQGRMSNNSAVRGRTDGRTDGQTDAIGKIK